MGFLIAIALTSFAADPVYALENGTIRIEVDPRLFAIRYIGFEGGENFVAPLTVSPEITAGTEWADPGGLHTDILPYTAQDAAVRRGPAEVLEYRSDYISMLGPPSSVNGMRLKKEIQLHKTGPSARFRVTAQRAAAEPARVALRNTARIKPNCTLRIERTDGEITVIAGPDSIFPAVVKSRRFWLIPVPPTSEMRGVVLGAAISRVTTVTDSGTWTRRLADPSTSESELPHGVAWLCLLDDPTKSYGSAFQGMYAEVNEGGLTTLEEVWEFDRRGR
ncbi:MAG: hypothetical protein SGI88_15835 [Candidatus Hydrogenedentes bacterium]|nr:hypothetical protein [Candidatus Hydrogenedentota bacterium]